MLLICTILILIYIVDNIISIKALLTIKNDIMLLEKDNTEEITTKIKSILTKYNWKEKRLLLAYPNVKKLLNI